MLKPNSVTWKNTIALIIEDENIKFMTIRVLRFHASNYPNEALRDASSSAATMFSNFEVELYSRSVMFLLVNAAMRSGAADTMDYESRHYLEKLHRKFFQNGCGVADPSLKSHFEKCQKRLQEIQRECNKNMHEEKTGIWLALDELEGAPKTFISRLKRGEGVYEDQYWVATKVTQSVPVMKHAVWYQLERGCSMLSKIGCQRTFPYSENSFYYGTRQAESLDAPTTLLTRLLRLKPALSLVAEILLKIF